MTTLLIAAAAAVAGGSIGETKPTELPPIYVEASRLDRTTLEIPSAATVLSLRDADTAGAHDVVRLLERHAPQVHVRHMGGANPALAEITMRGYGESGHGRTAVLVDGERLNSPDMSAPNLGRVALNGIDRIEVLGGPQTVLLGDGASAGAINIVTEPSGYDRRAYAEIRGGSWSTFGASTGVRGGFEEDGVKYWADSSWDHSDGYRHNSGYDLWNLDGGVKKEWDGGSWMRLSAFWNDSDYETPGPLSRSDWHAHPRRTNTPDDSYRRRTYGFNTTLNAKIDEHSTIRLTGTFSRREMKAYADGGSGALAWWSRNTYDIYSFRELAEWICDADVFGLGNEFILGAQHTWDRLHGRMKSNYSNTKCDYSRTAMDFFAQDTLHLADWFAVQVGGRFDRAWSENTRCTPKRRSDDNAAFDVAAIANPTESSKIYLKWSRFYRNPFLDEIPYDPRTFMPAGLLSPETGWNAEIGGEWNICSELSVGADAYWSRLHNEIFYDAIGGNNVNSDDPTIRRGVDAHIAWERDKVAGITLAASWTEAEFDGGAYRRCKVPLVPETTVSLSGRFWIIDSFYILGGYRYQSSARSASDFRNVRDTIPSCGTFNIGFVYTPEWKPLEGATVAFTIDNLFDRNCCDYSTYGANYWPGSGRSCMLTVRYEF